MSNNCLVTKLKGVVNNNELPYYGGIEVAFGAVAKSLGITFGVRPAGDNNPGKVVAKKGTFNVYDGNGTVVASNITSFDIPQDGVGYGFMPATDGSVIVYMDKYKSTLTNLGYLNWQPLPETIVDYEPMTINLKDLEYSKLYTMWNINRYDVKGVLDLTVLRDVERMVRVDFGCAYGANDYKIIVPSSLKFTSNLSLFKVADNKPGATILDLAELNLSSFENCVALTQIVAARSNYVTGSIDSLCDTLYANGKTSGTLTFYCGATKVTYKGEEWNTEKAIEKGWNMDVTFTANGWTSSWDA